MELVDLALETAPRLTAPALLYACDRDEEGDNFDAGELAPNKLELSRSAPETTNCGQTADQTFTSFLLGGVNGSQGLRVRSC